MIVDLLVVGIGVTAAAGFVHVAVRALQIARSLR